MVKKNEPKTHSHTEDTERRRVSRAPPRTMSFNQSRSPENDISKVIKVPSPDTEARASRPDVEWDAVVDEEELEIVAFMLTLGTFWIIGSWSQAAIISSVVKGEL